MKYYGKIQPGSKDLVTAKYSEDYADTAVQNLDDTLGAVAKSNSYLDLNDKPLELPIVTATEDNGKFLQVVNGVWDKVTVPNANGEEF